MTTNNLRHRRLRSGAAVLAVAIGLSSAPGFAQDSGTTTSDADGMIIVTGSRIARPDIESSSPVSFVGAEEFEYQQTANVEEVLNDLPQVIPSSTGASNNPGDGVATVDVRGLGSQRTLVLVDGRRYISYDTNQIVDLNTIPSALIERVDVVTGGASAVYGSDAIAGVVNFITKTDFEGIELNGNYEVSEHGDGQRYNVNGTIGSNFSDGRGNVVLHVDYYKRDSIFASAREATEVSYSDDGEGSLFPGGSSSIPDFRLTIPGLAQALGYATEDAAVRFDENGNAIAYNSSTDLYNYGAVNYLQVPQERYLGYAKAQYEISPAIVPYAEAVFINNRVSQELAPTPISNSTSYRDGTLGSNLMLHVYSPFLGADTAAALQALDTDGDGYIASGSYGRRYLETGSRNQADDRNAFRVLAGVKGDLGSNWAYDLYYQYSRTRNSSVQSGNVQLSALLAGLKTAYISPDGNTVSVTPVAGYTLGCADASARANGCVPVNVFGPGQIDADAAEYITISATNLTEASTKVYSGVITNSDLFDFGAGPIGLALGVERREEFAKYQPDTFLASGDVGGFNAGLPTQGGYELTEVFGELNVPVLSGLSWAESIELNGALRYSDYSNAVGGVWTWAVGGIWDVAGGFSLRGNYQQAIRGPSVEELFGGQTVDFSGASDPCQTPEAASGTLRDRCVANGVPAAVVGTDYGSGGTSFPAFIGGNPNLTQESAKTWTIGAVYVPEFIDRLSLTVDYYNITIDDFIGTVGTQNIVNACLNAGIEEYCDLITRSSTGELESFVDLNINAASLHTEGLDLGARYSLPLGDGFLGGGSAGLSFDFKGSYLFALDYDAVAGLGLPVNECAGKFGRVCSDTVASGPTPNWRHALRTTYKDGDAFLSVLWRHIGPSSDDDDATVYAVEHLKAADYFDLAVGYQVTENFSLSAGVDNLFNKGFQPIASTQQGGNGQQSNTFPTTYDVLGRYFSLSAKVNF